MKSVFRLLTVAAVTSLLSWSSSLASAAGISFTIDPTSSLTLDANASGVTLAEQGPGSLTTTYSGSISVDVDNLLTPTTIDFLSSSMVAANNGNWLPQVGGGAPDGMGLPIPGDPGTPSPANYASFNSTSFLLAGDVYSAIRNISIDTTSPGGLVVAGGTSFPSTQTFTVATGTIDFNVEGGFATGADASSSDFSGSASLNQAAGGSSYALAGSIATLTIPVNVDIPILDGSGASIGNANLSGLVTATADISTGDFDQDGDQDGRDFIIWQQGFGTLGGALLSNGDGNFDGDVLGDDLAIWEGSLGALSASSGLSASTSTIPEPSSLALLGLAIGMLSLPSRKRGN